MHQLGSYLKFFNILREMESQKQIDAREKQLLRINFTTKERRLMLILEELGKQLIKIDDENEEEFRFSLINYIKQSETQQKQLFKRSSSRSRSSITAISPLIKKQIEVIDDEQVQKDLDQAIKLISNAINSATQGNEIHKKLMKIQQQIAVINSQQQDLEFQEISVCGEQEIQQQYKNLKAQFEEYIHIHSEIIENDLNYNSISTLLKAFLKTLINIDNFSFIALKEGHFLLYQSATDSQQIIEDPKYISEVTSLPVLKICKITQNSDLSQLLNTQDTSFAFATPKRVFFFHTESDIPIEQIVNDYNLFEEVQQICQFLSESVDHAIAKIFSPTSIADMILDIAISFVRCSKYIFIHTMNKVFNDVASESQRDWIKEQLKTLTVQHNKLDAKIQAKIRKQILEHETLTYVNKLEESNPEMKNSVASLYMPFSQSVKQRTRSIEHLKPLDQFMHPIRHSEMPMKKSVPLSKHQISNFAFHQFDGIQGMKDSDSPVLETGQKEHKKSKFEKSGSPRLSISSFCLDQNDDIVDTFDFNVMEIKSASLKHKAVWSIMQKNNFIEDYQIPCEILQTFLEQVQFHYNQTNNPYHNYDHGVTVMQTSHYLLLQCDTFALDDLQRFSLIISALCHDVGHTGRTNLFEINSLSELAIRYHDKSVLEQHHAALTIQLLKNEQSNILVNVTSEQFRNFRKSLIQNILNTDMSEHFRLIKDFENRTSEVDPKLLCGVMMHVSDFGGTIKAPELSRQWSQRVNQEFIAQFKQEEELGYPTQPYMKDLDKAHVMAKSEIGFLKVIVRPIVLILSQFLNDKLQHCVDNIDKSIEHWESIK